MPSLMRPRSACLFLVGLFFCGILCSGCGTVQFVHSAQPIFVVPAPAQTEAIAARDLEALKKARPEVHTKLLKNVSAWKLEIKQWRATAKLYNEGVRERNRQARARIME